MDRMETYGRNSRIHGIGAEDYHTASDPSEPRNSGGYAKAGGQNAQQEALIPAAAGTFCYHSYIF